MKQSARVMAVAGLVVLVLALPSACGRGIAPAGDRGLPVGEWRPPVPDVSPYPGWEGRPWPVPDYAPLRRDAPPWPKVDKYPIKPDVGPWKPDWYWPKPDFSIWVSEKVTCMFSGSSTMQTCYSTKGPTCSGIGSCTVTLSGYLGEQVGWKSSCGGSATTYMDGMSETIYFSCGSTVVTETDTCVFGSSTTMQSCSTNLGPGCSGISSCNLTLSGSVGLAVIWKSTCGASAPITTLNGANKTITFSCPQPIVTETVTCYFNGSTTYQQCYSSKGSCQGLLGCTIKVSGPYGEVVSWKSTCGGYASTTMDGKDQNANFYCPVVFDGGPPPLPDFAIPPPPPWP